MEIDGISTQISIYCVFSLKTPYIYTTFFDTIDVTMIYYTMYDYVKMC